MRCMMLPGLLALTACTAGPPERTDAMSAPRGDATQSVAPRTLTIELLALDLETCGRCTGTGSNLDAAIATVAQVLSEADVELTVRKTVVTSVLQAERLRFESSPTIRINGRDIAFELRESSCGDICGCEGQVDCRVWVWQGKEHVEAPKALIVDAILRAYGQAWEPAPKPARGYRVPENLRMFFDAKSKNAGAGSVLPGTDECCDASKRASCCGGAAEGAVCGGKG